MVYCEHCGYTNREETASCLMCGVNLFPIATLSDVESSPAPATNVTTESFKLPEIDPDMFLGLCIGIDKVLMPFPSGSELMLGRHTIPITRTNLELPGSHPYISMLKGRPLMLPKVVSFLTLTPFGAIEAGVSREHALLQHEYRRVTIQDCNSRNGTFVNGSRIPPGEKRTLQHSDEILLGALRIVIQFEQRATIQFLPITPPLPPA